MLMVLRPYQYYATEAIIERVKAGNQFGYIWHTTGSGKTLTSFKTAQILTQLDGVHKVVFVVDGKDLDYQTTKEFNSFSTGSIDGTNNTKALVKQLTGSTPLIVTTIQKLNAAIKGKHLAKMETLKDKRIVFIFDECHRSQFGDTHKAIKTFFTGSQMFGFTGTPIFDENAGSNKYGRRTTDHLFTKCLHRYVITDAIRDGNVLKFSIEYISTFKKKDHIIDIEVEAIDENEVMEADVRLNAVTDYIIAHHNRKTHSKEFTAIFCAPNIPTLIKYYKLFREKHQAGEHNLRVATIFSYRSNEEDKDVGTNYGGDDDFADDEDTPEYNTQHTRDELENFIQDYNARYGTNFTNKDSHSFYQYYNDIARRVKNREVDILLVVNMFLTGFDSKPLNTLYVDKNLKHHGLIQAYSRTNRILNEKKSQGNIINFRNLKPATDEAIALFSRIEDKKEIIIQPYEEYIETFNQQYVALLLLAPTIDSVNNLPSEDEELEFVKAFRELIRIKNVLSTFTEFTFEDLAMDEQQFEDYKSKYLDLYDKAKSHNRKEKVSILNDVDFELELIHRDEVNVAYILKLLAKLKATEPEKQPKQKKEIIELVAGDTQLRSKRELIEQFIENNLPALNHADEISEAFGKYWSEQRDVALQQLSVEEGLDKDKLNKVIADFLYTEKRPLSDDIIAMMHQRPRLKERATTAERITNKLLNFVETFISGIEE